LQIGAATRDCQWTNCHCEYNKYTSILFGDSATAIQNLKFTDWQFLYNAQYPTYSGAIQNRSSGTTAGFIGCNFSNMPGYAYSYGMGTGSSIDFSNCIFDGTKTFAGYAQSTTAGAVNTANETVRLVNCTFKNLPAPPGTAGLVPSPQVVLGGTFTSTLEIDGGKYFNNTNPAGFISVTNSVGSSVLSVTNLQGDASQILVNNQSIVQYTIRNCRDWFGPISTSGAKHYVVVPYQFSNVYQITLRANINVGGLADYRKTAVVLAEKDNDYSAGYKSFITTAVPIQGAANLNGPIAVTVEFGSVGGGTVITNSNSGSLAVSWPGTYTYESIDVQMI